MLVHDLIKIKLVRAGYLPNYPYHLISDKEMCEAFISANSVDTSNLTYNRSRDIWEHIKLTNLTGSFFDEYPLLDESLKPEYDTLTQCILYHICNLIFSNSSESSYVLPDWVYSYMLGKVISINSSIADIHDLIYPLGIDNIDDLFTSDASYKCLEVSKDWVNKLSSSYINATLGQSGSCSFDVKGKYDSRTNETAYNIPSRCPKYSYVIPGSIRLKHLDDRYVDNGQGTYRFVPTGKCCCDESLTTVSNIDYTSNILSTISFVGDISNTDVIHVQYDYTKSQTDNITDRPPTMFGEPHIIKSIRMQQADPIR